MKLSAPIYSLKRLAKSISRTEKIALHVALDRVANQEGFRNWSLLSAQVTVNWSNQILEVINPGELILLGARPGHGKTRVGLELVAKSTKLGKQGWFFTLEWNEADIEECLISLGQPSITTNHRFHFDTSDSISADYIIDCLEESERGTVAVVDYLQLLDQNRSKPVLSSQMHKLKSFAQMHGYIIVCISQIDRSFETTGRQAPTINDVRLPNPLDLSVFDRTCFLHDSSLAVT